MNASVPHALCDARIMINSLLAFIMSATLFLEFARSSNREWKSQNIFLWIKNEERERERKRQAEWY